MELLESTERHMGSKRQDTGGGGRINCTLGIVHKKRLDNLTKVFGLGSMSETMRRLIDQAHVAVQARQAARGEEQNADAKR